MGLGNIDWFGREKKRLLQRVQNEPDNDDPRYDYAEYLRRKAQPALADFIESQCHREAIGDRFPTEEEIRLQRQHPEWQAPFRQRIEDALGFAVTLPLQFRRGFAEVGIFDADEFIANARAMAKAHPLLREMHIFGVRQDVLRALQRPELLMARKVTLGAQELIAPPSTVLNDGDMPAVSGCPNLRNVRQLDILAGMLSMNPISDEGAAAFAKAAKMPDLEELGFIGDNIGHLGVYALGESPNLPKLRRLHIHNLTQEILDSVAQNLPHLELTKARDSFGGDGFDDEEGDEPVDAY